jgi:uncharacterized protein (DUF1697 family)
MTSFIALLRGVNVGGHAKVAMSDLRGLLEDLGFGDVRTLLQSGNAVFSSDTRASAKLEAQLEKAAEARLGLRPDFFVRSADEWGKIIAENPFGDEARRDPSHVLMMALKSAPDASAVAALQAAVAGPEIIRGHGRELYVTYPAGIGRSKLTSAVIEKKLGTRGTARNWNTVLKLDALARTRT